jgi:hypothetical protein
VNRETIAMDRIAPSHHRLCEAETAALVWEQRKRGNGSISTHNHIFGAQQFQSMDELGIIVTEIYLVS